MASRAQEQPAGARPRRIAWYRSPLGRAALIDLNRRSDVLGFLQTGGYLAVLAVTGAAAVLSVGRLAWPLVVLLFLAHGTCSSFLVNGFHELVHDSVFKTRWLNRAFLWVFSFWGWYSHVQFWASHTAHHKYTLHPPDDLEVVLPTRITLAAFFRLAVVDLPGIAHTARQFGRWSAGRVRGEWESHLFPASDPAARRRLFAWARIVVLGHGAIIAASLALGWWALPLVTTLSRFYAGGLQYLCNAAQHVGLQDNVADFRLSTRTIILNPILRFLYWHMNFHIEHHMYAAVPCYRLGRLHRLIRRDLPPSPRGLLATWRGIGEILRRQQADPGYQFRARLPVSAARPGRG